MKSFSLPIQVRWSDIDQNRHLRHSAYYDYGATARISCFSQHGLTNQKLEELHIGLILFREEAIFKREIKFEDRTLRSHSLAANDASLSRLRRGFKSRWDHCLVRRDRARPPSFFAVRRAM